MFFKIQIAVCTFICILLNQSFSQDYDTLFLKPGPQQGKDAVVRSCYPNINEGDHWDFLSMASTINFDPFIDRAFIEFDLGSIPEQSIIIEAKLSLFYSEQTGGPGHDGENHSYLLKITEEWDEHTIKWYTQPSVSFENPVYLPTSTSQYQDYLDIDVTGLITDLYNFPELYHGFSMRLAQETPYRTMTFSSSDQSNPNRWPELEIIYIPCVAPTSAFTYEIDDELNVTFNNQSQNYENCLWDFGDGYYSSLENPEHSYAEQGNYNVCLTVSNMCTEATTCDSIFASTGVNNTPLNSFGVFPNPFRNYIQISNPGSIPFPSLRFSLIDSKGIDVLSKVVDLSQKSKIEIFTSDIKPGIYFLTIQSDEFVSVRKLIKLTD